MKLSIGIDRTEKQLVRRCSAERERGSQRSRTEFGLGVA